METTALNSTFPSLSARTQRRNPAPDPGLIRRTTGTSRTQGPHSSFLIRIKSLISTAMPYYFPLYNSFYIFCFVSFFRRGGDTITQDRVVTSKNTIITVIIM